MSTAQFFQSTRQQLRDWSWFKRSLLGFTILTFMVSSFMFLTAPGTEMRIWMANSVIITQHREWAWIFVGTEQRDSMVRKMHQFIEENAEEKQQFGMVKVKSGQAARKNRTMDELIKVEDISGPFWKGKRMYVFDPKTIRLMTPAKSGEGERITSMVKRTGAVAGVNAGGFDDPEGLGNGFAAIGAIISGGEVIYTDQDSSVAQHIVGFTKDGTLVIGKYNMFELKDMGISEAASFYPRVIANGKPLPINDVSRAPRTAVAQKADGTIIFIVADGRQTHSVGATLKEIQELFLADDVVNAGFLDGGASSQLVVNGELITKPSSRYGERRLPSAYLVYDHPQDAVANRVWDGLTTINAGGSFDHPDFLKEQALRRANTKNTPAPAVTPTPAKTTEANKTKTDSNIGTTGTSSPSGTTEPNKPATPSDAAKPAQGTDNSKSITTPANDRAKDAGGKESTTLPKTQPSGSGAVTTDPTKQAESTTGAGAGGASIPSTPSIPAEASNPSRSTPSVSSDASTNNKPAAPTDKSTKNSSPDSSSGDTTTKTTTTPTSAPASASPAASSEASTSTTGLEQR